MPSRRMRTQHRNESATSKERATEAHKQNSAIIPIDEDLLRKYGVEDTREIEAVENFIRQTHFYGNNALSHGLLMMFNGMQHAVAIYSEMKAEIYSLHQCILELKKEATDAKDQLAIAETTARQRLEVTIASPIP